MGAPVFALTGYAVASHVIPRGFVCRSLVWLGRRFAVGVVQRADLPQGNAGQLDGNGGMRVAWAWRLCLTCLTRWVRHVIPRGFARRCAVGLWQRVTAGVMRGNLMAAGVCSLRGCDACKTVVNGG